MERHPKTNGGYSSQTEARVAEKNSEEHFNQITRPFTEWAVNHIQQGDRGGWIRLLGEYRFREESWKASAWSREERSRGIREALESRNDKKITDAVRRI